MLPLADSSCRIDFDDDVPTIPVIRAATRVIDDTFSRPTARYGALGRGSFVELLAMILDRGLTGTLSLTTPEGDAHDIYFERGVAAKAELMTPCFRVGEELTRWGFLDYTEVEAASYEATKRGMHIGTYLIEKSAILRAAVEGALKSQVVERVGLLANLPAETMYEIHSRSDLLDAAGGGRAWPADPLDALLATVRSMYDRSSVRATALRASQQRLMLRDPQCCSFATFAEATVLTTIARDEPMLDELLDGRIATPEDVYTVVATLVLGRNLVTVPVDRQSGTITRVDV
jgi:hypothetical protein